MGWDGAVLEEMVWRERARDGWVDCLFSLLWLPGVLEYSMCRCLRPVRLGEYKVLNPGGACLLLEAFG